VKDHQILDLQFVCDFAARAAMKSHLSQIRVMLINLPEEEE
jgi:hypothetical protein